MYCRPALGVSCYIKGWMEMISLSGTVKYRKHLILFIAKYSLLVYVAMVILLLAAFQ